MFLIGTLWEIKVFNKGNIISGSGELCLYFYLGPELLCENNEASLRETERERERVISKKFQGWMRYYKHDNMLIYMAKEKYSNKRIFPRNSHALLGVANNFATF